MVAAAHGNPSAHLPPKFHEISFRVPKKGIPIRREEGCLHICQKPRRHHQFNIVSYIIICYSNMWWDVRWGILDIRLAPSCQRSPASPAVGPWPPPFWLPMTPVPQLSWWDAGNAQCSLLKMWVLNFEYTLPSTKSRCGIIDGTIAIIQNAYYDLKYR